MANINQYEKVFNDQEPPNEGTEKFYFNKSKKKKKIHRKHNN